MEKKKVSRFEYAIMECINPPDLADYEPFTEAEEVQQRVDKIRNTMSQVRVVNQKQQQDASTL